MLDSIPNPPFGNSDVVDMKCVCSVCRVCYVCVVCSMCAVYSHTSKMTLSKQNYKNRLIQNNNHFQQIKINPYFMKTINQKQQRIDKKKKSLKNHNNSSHTSKNDAVQVKLPKTGPIQTNNHQKTQILQKEKPKSATEIKNPKNCTETGRSRSCMQMEQLN